MSIVGGVNTADRAMLYICSWLVAAAGSPEHGGCTGRHTLRCSQLGSRLQDYMESYTIGGMCMATNNACTGILSNNPSQADRPQS